MTKSVGSMMNGGANPNADPHHFYPTPAPTTRALLPYIVDAFPSEIWECAAGEGHMVRALREASFAVTGTDLIDRGAGFEVVDFLATKKTRAPAIITNPPFKYLDAFIEHALIELKVEHVAFIMPSIFWHAASRVPLFRLLPPNLYLPMTWRIDATGGGNPTMNCAWVVWSTALPDGTFMEPMTSDEQHPGRLDPIFD